HDRILDLLVGTGLESVATASSPLWRDVELYWRMAGSSACIQCLMSDPQWFASAFINHKLKKQPGAFTDADLEFVAHKFQHGPTDTYVQGIRFTRLGTVADHLMKNPLELSRDVSEVKRRVSEYGFNPELNELLDKVETGLVAIGDKFEQAGLLKHLRTFFEKVHEHAALTLRAAKPETTDGT